MPKITAATVAENREQRREALLMAAATLIQRSGGGFTVAEVANEVGLSRSAVYEYYRSASELIADVLIDEFAAWSGSLAASAVPGATTEQRVHAWVHAVLDYVVDGRHSLLRAAGSTDIPPGQRARVHELHQELIAPLVEALTTSGYPDPRRQARFVWGVVEAAINRIENGECLPDDEIRAVIDFIDGALGARLHG